MHEKKYLGHCETLAGAWKTCRKCYELKLVLPCVLKEFKYLLPSANYFLLLGLTSSEITSLSKDDGEWGTCARPPSLHMRHPLKYRLGYVQHILWIGVRTRKVFGIWVESIRVDIFSHFSSIIIPFVKACPAQRIEDLRAIGIGSQMTQMLSYANPFSATCWNMLKQSWGHLKTEPATHATWQVTDWWVVEECNKPCGGGEVGWGMRR